LLVGKVATEVDEGMVLIATGTHTAYHANTLTVGHTVIFTIAASTCQTSHFLGFYPTPLLIEFY
jgi:hypothetical protein